LVASYLDRAASGARKDAATLATSAAGFVAVDGYCNFLALVQQLAVLGSAVVWLPLKRFDLVFYLAEGRHPLLDRTVDVLELHH